jgi:translation initiation factor 4G
MYAKFCKRMLEEMSPEIKDENVRDKNNNPVVGGALFRKYLLNRCQEEFERGWEVNLPEKPEGGEEAAMLSDEYYIAAAAKRRGLGLIQFIGELYKLDMLTIRIMHECVIRLLNFEGLPDESAVESLTKLLRTVGAKMEQAPNGPAMLDTYFERIRIIMQMEGLPSRLYYMLLDTVDLRKANWRSKDDAKGPKTISEIREDALAQQVAAEAERARQSQRGPRPPVGRGDVRSFSGGGMMPPPDYPRNQVGIDDLKKLTRGPRQTGAAPGSSLGPTSMLASRSSSGRKGGLGPLSRGAEDSGASSRTNTPPVKDKESTASANQYRYSSYRKGKSFRKAHKHYSALAGLDASGEGADDIASPPSTASSPPVVKSHPAIASATVIENDSRNSGTTSS